MELFLAHTKLQKNKFYKNRGYNMFPKGIIVSCQALEGNPLRDSHALSIMAKAAELGGAKAIRANGVEDITAMRKVLLNIVD